MSKNLPPELDSKLPLSLREVSLLVRFVLRDIIHDVKANLKRYELYQPPSESMRKWKVGMENWYRRGLQFLEKYERFDLGHDRVLTSTVRAYMAMKQAGETNVETDGRNGDNVYTEGTKLSGNTSKNDD